MACGKPVIAYEKGGALETVQELETGIFFAEQSKNDLKTAILKLEKMSFDREKVREHALSFDKDIFKQKIKNFVEKCLKAKQ